MKIHFKTCQIVNDFTPAQQSHTHTAMYHALRWQVTMKLLINFSSFALAYLVTQQSDFMLQLLPYSNQIVA